MSSILFVCTGNTCRSPMAEGLLKYRLKEPLLATPTWQVASAGTWAAEGQPAAREAVAAMAQRGIDLSLHRSQRVSPALLFQFDLILTMESNHRDALLAEFPHLSGKVFLLSQMVGRDFDIADPIGKPLIEYERTAQQIDQILESGWEKINKLSSSPKKLT